MKKIFLFLFIVLSLQAYSQNDYLVTLNGIGKLKLDMKLSDVENMLGKKFILKNMDDTEGSWMDTVKTKYKNSDIILYFERQYEDDETFNMVLAGLQVSNPLFKTNTGIGIGADKMKIIATYEMNRLSVMPDYTDDTYTTLSKTLSTIWVYNDESENTIAFHLKNKKVVSIELMRFYGD